MELKCPQCGKWMAVSREELLMHDCQVVCPQCLAVCRYENDTLVVRDDSDAPYRHTASVETTDSGNVSFCHSCGKQLPAGIRFCPYCGADLKAPFGKSQAPEPQPKPEPRQRPVVEKPRPVEEKKKEDPTPVQRQSSHVEDKLRTMSHHYNSSGVVLHQNGTMPGRTFKIIAYAVIAVLLALLVYIIIAGASIETAV